MATPDSSSGIDRLKAGWRDTPWWAKALGGASLIVYAGELTGWWNDLGVVTLQMFTISLVVGIALVGSRIHSTVGRIESEVSQTNDTLTEIRVLLEERL